MQDYPAAASAASGALKEDPQNVKALYRRGLARNHLGERTLQKVMAFHMMTSALFPST
jgi:hypothetical protein